MRTGDQDGDGHILGDENDGTSPTQQSQVVPVNWPKAIPYLAQPQLSPSIDIQILRVLNTPTASTSAWPKIPLSDTTCPNPNVRIEEITDTFHPAHGQSGLFALRHFHPDELVVLYLGKLQVDEHDGSDKLDKSDYCVSFDREVRCQAGRVVSISIDAAEMGNEGRFVNDYRGVPSRSQGHNGQRGTGKAGPSRKKGKATTLVEGPNAEFRDCWVQVEAAVISEAKEMPSESGGPRQRHATPRRPRWERRLGVFVLGPGKSGKRKKGIQSGEEILVSYGRSFWSERKNEIPQDNGAGSVQ